MIDDQELSRCEECIGFQFQDKALLVHALTHGSAKSDEAPSNERYEFLGDSILGMVISALLFSNEEELDEGRMTQIKAQVVSKPSLTVVAQKTQLREFIIVGKMFEDRQSISASIVADAVEALIAAVYLDAGLESAIRFVERHFEPALIEAVKSPGKQDFKSVLGQWAQKVHACNPVYKITDMDGPDHQLVFSVEVMIDGVKFAEAKGTSKKSAEQEAARLALDSQGLL